MRRQVFQLSPKKKHFENWQFFPKNWKMTPTKEFPTIKLWHTVSICARCDRNFSFNHLCFEKNYFIKTQRALGKKGWMYFNFFSSARSLRQITQMELLHFSFDQVEERSQRAQVETVLQKDSTNDYLWGTDAPASSIISATNMLHLLQLLQYLRLAAKDQVVCPTCLSASFWIFLPSLNKRNYFNDMRILRGLRTCSTNTFK